MWNPILGLIKEIRKCESVRAHLGGLSLCFVCIDTMAYLGMPANQAEQTRDDFIAWADSYLRGHPDQPYKYRGLDVYAARCAVLHAFGAESRLHRENQNITMFGYSNGGLHLYNPGINPRLVIIGLASFINDVVIAVEGFMEACKDDADLRGRVEQRLTSVLSNFALLRERSQKKL